MRKLIAHRWKIIFSLLALLYVFLGIQLYRMESGQAQQIHICPQDTNPRIIDELPAEPNFEQCVPQQPDKSIGNLISTVFFFPLHLALLTGVIAYILPLFGLFALDKLWQRKRYTLALIPLSITLSILLLELSTYLPVRIETYEQLERVEFGLPMKFVIQNQSHRSPPLPWDVHIDLVLNAPTTILWPELLISFIGYFLVTFLCVRSVVRLFSNKIPTIR